MASSQARELPGTAAPIRRDALVDLGVLLGLALLVLGAGIGLRDPWPADEPRFALIARDMLANGNWFVPSVGGDLYADKPPVFFWATALCLWITGSLRVAFLLPPLLAGLGTLALVYDLARRLWNRETAIAASLLLLTTLQFAMQARAAQIDGFLLFWTTLSLYGIARHLLSGPSWGWYAIGGFAAGVGVITKGVGFLPLLLLLPYAALRARGFSGLARGGTWQWVLAPMAALAGIAVWCVPMLLTVATSGDPAYVDYRNEILFQQTVERYASAWHHHQPPWYFIVEVIPFLWLPGTALLPWLVPGWRDAWRAKDSRPWLLLIWAALVVLFFSLSPGKRGVYVLPALPAFVLAASPLLPGLWARRGPQLAGAALAALLALAAFGGLIYLQLDLDRAAQLRLEHGVTSTLPLAVIGALCVAALVTFGSRRGLAAFAASIWAVLVVQGLWINPMLDASRSGRALIAALERTVPDGVDLGLAVYREQFLLHIDRPTTNFGHARWREAHAVAEDAAAWLDAAPNRALLIDEGLLQPCFGDARKRSIGVNGRVEWWVVTGRADPECARAGDLRMARTYTPPRSKPVRVDGRAAAP